jgi:hypothetical protein
VRKLQSDLGVKLIVFNLTLLIINLIAILSNIDLDIIQLLLGITTFIIPAVVIYIVTYLDDEDNLFNATLRIIGIMLSYHLLIGFLLGFTGFFNHEMILIINIIVSLILFRILHKKTSNVIFKKNDNIVDRRIFILLLAAIIFRWSYVVLIFSKGIPEWDDNFAHMGRILSLLDSGTLLDANLPLAIEVPHRPGNYNPFYPGGFYAFYAVISITTGISVFNIYFFMFYSLTLIEVLLLFNIGIRTGKPILGALLAFFYNTAIYSGYYHGLYWVVPDFLSTLLLLFIIQEIWFNKYRKLPIILLSLSAIFSHYVGLLAILLLIVNVIVNKWTEIKQLKIKYLLSYNWDSLFIIVTTTLYYLFLALREGSIINIILKGQNEFSVNTKNEIFNFLFEFQLFLALISYALLYYTFFDNDFLNSKKALLIWFLIESLFYWAYFWTTVNIADLPYIFYFIIVRILVVTLLINYTIPREKVVNKFLINSILFIFLASIPVFFLSLGAYFFSLLKRVVILISWFLLLIFIETYAPILKQSIFNFIILFKNIKLVKVIPVKNNLKIVLSFGLILLITISTAFTGIYVNYDRVLEVKENVLHLDSNDESIINQLQGHSGEIVYDDPKTYSYFLGKGVFNHPIFQNLTVVPWILTSTLYVVYNLNWHVQLLEDMGLTYNIEMTGNEFTLYSIFS